MPVDYYWVLNLCKEKHRLRISMKIDIPAVELCIRMEDGKIYPCNTIACIEHFNKFFDKSLKVTRDDVMEIDNIHNIREVYEFLMSLRAASSNQRFGGGIKPDFRIKPKPFRKYCNRKGIQFGIEWGVSEREITE
jgi:hypothetical protein